MGISIFFGAPQVENINVIDSVGDTVVFLHFAIGSYFKGHLTIEGQLSQVKRTGRRTRSEASRDKGQEKNFRIA